MSDRVETLRQVRIVSFTLSVMRSAGKLVNHTIPELLRSDVEATEFDRAAIDPATAAPATALGPGPRDEVPLPLTLTEVVAARNPTFTAEDVTDFGAVDFIADPFMLPGPDRWHLFFEVCNYARDPDAVIGHATSPDGLRWEYNQAVLNTGEHLSFPYVFEWEGTRYMVPEEGGADGRAIRLYEATAFPGGWEPRATLVSADHRTDDTVLFRWRDRWWLIVGDDDINGFRAYHSDSLVANDWKPHEDNPLVTGRPAAFRPGGRPIVGSDSIVIFFQDCERWYGEAVRAFEITSLSPETYADEERPESPVLEGTGARIGWNSGRMHHVDPWYADGRWLCVADGNIAHSTMFTGRHWALGMYSAD